MRLSRGEGREFVLVSAFTLGLGLAGCSLAPGPSSDSSAPTQTFSGSQEAISLGGDAIVLAELMPDRHVEIVEDGIDAAEAEEVGRAYLAAVLDAGCGFPEVVARRGNEWELNTRLGYAGEPGPVIYVDVQNGSARHVDTR